MFPTASPEEPIHNQPSWRTGALDHFELRIAPRPKVGARPVSLDKPLPFMLKRPVRGLSFRHRKLAVFSEHTADESSRKPGLPDRRIGAIPGILFVVIGNGCPRTFKDCVVNAVPQLR